MLFVALGISALACGGSDGPAAPSDNASAPRQCRTYASAYATTFTSQGIPDSSGTTACTFDAPSLSLRCTQTTQSPLGCSGTSTWTATYASVLDFIEEGAAFGLTRALRIERTTTSCLGVSTARHVNTYDTQKRQLRSETQMDGRAFSTTAFTAWDARGRPTVSQGDGCSASGTITYDEGARTVMDVGCSGSSVRTTYDTNGNLLTLVFTNRGAVTYSETNSITATASACL